MGVADDVISKEEFLTWVPASDAVHDLRKTMFDAAALEIVRRAAAEFLVARIERGRVAKGALPVSLSPYQRIGDTTWKKLLHIGNINASNLWLTNSLDITLTIGGGEKTLNLFGIRFDPVGLDEITPKRTSGADLPTPPDETRWPAVSAAAVAAWYDAYKLAYKDNERTLEHAWACARGAFPKRTVTREVIRKLMPAGKPGPKGVRGV